MTVQCDMSAEESQSNPYTITEEDLQRQLRKGNHGRYCTQFFSAIIASVGAFSLGTVLGWSSPAVYYHSNQLIHHALSTSDQAWVASVVALGASFGIIPWSYCNQRFGPKKTMQLQAPLNIISWLVIAYIEETDSTTYIAARFFSGFLSISYVVSGECLLVDTVHQKNLQHMYVMYQSALLLGVLTTWAMGQIMEEESDTYICASFCLFHVILLSILPESPVFLYEKSPSQAEKALIWYRGRKEIYTEMRDLKQYSEARKLDPEANEAMLYSKVVVKAILIVMGIKFFSMSSGYYIFLFYNVDMVHELGENVDNIIDTMFYGVMMFLCNVISMTIHYRSSFSIRKPLILSSALVTLILTAFTFHLYVEKNLKVKFDPLTERIITVVCVCCLVTAYETGLSIYAEMALIDYVPNEVYPRARNILKVWHWFLVFVFVKNVITVRDMAPFSYACILMLAVASFIGIFYMKYVVVETKGKSLIQVQRDIGGMPIGTRGRFRHHVRLITTST